MKVYQGSYENMPGYWVEVRDDAGSVITALYYPTKKSANEAARNLREERTK